MRIETPELGRQSAIGNPNRQSAIQSAIGNPNRQPSNLNRQSPFEKSAIGDRQSAMDSREHPPKLVAN
jgi:hypothetical protein